MSKSMKNHHGMAEELKKNTENAIARIKAKFVDINSVHCYQEAGSVGNIEMNKSSILGAEQETDSFEGSN